MDNVMPTCKHCGGQFQKDSEYGISIELFHECVWCHFGPTRGTGTDLDRKYLREVYEKRHQYHKD